MIGLQRMEGNTPASGKSAMQDGATAPVKLLLIDSSVPRETGLAAEDGHSYAKVGAREAEEDGHSHWKIPTSSQQGGEQEAVHPKIPPIFLQLGSRLGVSHVQHSGGGEVINRREIEQAEEEGQEKLSTIDLAGGRRRQQHYHQDGLSLVGRSSREEGERWGMPRGVGQTRDNDDNNNDAALRSIFAHRARRTNTLFMIPSHDDESSRCRAMDCVRTISLFAPPLRKDESSRGRSAIEEERSAPFAMAAGRVLAMG